MKLLSSSFFLTLIVLSITACNKNAITNDIENIDTLYKQGIYVGDTIPEDAEAELEKYGMNTPSDDQFLGLDGESIGRHIEKNGIKGNIINAMVKKAKELTRLKTILSYPSEGTDKPAQNGLVYSYGQRDYQNRLVPPAGNLVHRKYAVYGTDCSGLIINLLNNASVAISNNTSVATFEEALYKALKASSVYKNVSIYNMGVGVSISEIRTGDFIKWPGHIGFVCELKDGTKAMFQSNGTGFPKNEADQIKNLGPNRGVRIINLDQAIKGKGYWGSNYTILRFIEAGDSMEGGLVYYLDDDRKHGYVCTLSDQAASRTWGPNVFVNGTVENIGAGKSNTMKIVNVLGLSSAAGLCDGLTLNGYDDWFLPSRLELFYMYENLAKRNLGNFTHQFYWSSTEFYDNTYFTAYIVDMSNGNSPKTFHSDTYAVRAIRKF